jgi:formylglycine-generating enzyme required for sulfatase activity
MGPRAEGLRRPVGPEPSATADPPRFTNFLGMTLVRIEPGPFLMGSTKAQIDTLMTQFPDVKPDWFDDEQPQHPVVITRPFYLTAHPVTVGQFRRFVEVSASKTDGKWQSPGFAQGEDHPVVCVSHDDALEFLAWLNKQEKAQAFRYRLPTEAEWEHACRVGGKGVYGLGDDPAELSRVAWFLNNSDGATHPVGQKEANAIGLYDMLGNVWEWCDDPYDPAFYQSSPTEDPRNTKGVTLRVFRGGSWGFEPWGCRPACRRRLTPASRYYDLGFRVAADRQ